MFNALCCLLCLESSSDQIELDSREGNSLNTKEVIELHFKEELKMMTHIEVRVVCRKCWGLVQSFHEFYLNVQRAHQEAVDTLKNVSSEKDIFEIKEEIECSKEDISPSRRHRERTKRQKIKDISNVSFETNLLLKESQEKIEDLILPATTTTSSNGICPEQIDIVLPLSDVKEEDSVEYIDTAENSGASDTDEIGMSVLDDSITKRPSVSVKSHQHKSVHKKTAEFDEYIAKMNFKLTCCICHISIGNFKTLKIHFRKEHQTSGYVLCCGKKLPERGLLIDHINFHVDPDYFKCTQCGKRMSERRSLDRHLLYAHGERKRGLRCSICSKGFFRATCLTQHYKTHVTEDKKTVPCTKCDKTFADDVELGKHMRHTHLNAYAKICDICGASIKGRDAFERHQSEHAGVPRKLINCDLCDSVLTTKYGLARHMKTMHTEEYQTPQVCPICSKVSPSLQAHQYHIKYMHSIKRKHVCKLCDKAFKWLTDFKEHMATHTGEALYTCSFCPQTFKSNGNMYTHRKKKHPKEWAELCASKKRLAVPAKEAILISSPSEQE